MLAVNRRLMETFARNTFEQIQNGTFNENTFFTAIGIWRRHRLSEAEKEILRKQVAKIQAKEITLEDYINFYDKIHAQNQIL